MPPPRPVAIRAVLRPRLLAVNPESETGTLLYHLKKHRPEANPEQAAKGEAKPDPKVAAIKELPKLVLKESTFNGGRPPEPIVLRSEKEASETSPKNLPNS